MIENIKTWLLYHCAEADLVARQRYCVLLLINSAGCVLALFVGFFTLYYQLEPLSAPQVWTAFTIAAAMIASTIVLFHGKYQLAAHATVLGTFASIWYLVIQRSGLQVAARPEILYAIAILTLPALLLGRSWALIYGLASVLLSGVAAAHLVMDDGIAPEVAAGVAVDIAVGSVFVVFVTVLMARIYEIALDRVKQLLELQEQYAAALRRIEAQKEQFYSETIYSVTNGKLRIHRDRSEVQHLIDDAALSIQAAVPDALSTARHQVAEFFEASGLGGADLEAFMIGVGEAMSNAVRHAGGGEVYAGRSNGSIWAGASDSGPGIESLILPRALLMAGFSTKHSLGLGYTIMLEVSDRVILNTSDRGTTVVLLKNLYESEDIPEGWADLE